MPQLFLLLNNLSPLFKHFVITDPWSLSRYKIVIFFFKRQLHLVKRPNMKIQKVRKWNLKRPKLKLNQKSYRSSVQPSFRVYQNGYPTALVFKDTKQAILVNRYILLSWNGPFQWSCGCKILVKEAIHVK